MLLIGFKTDMIAKRRKIVVSNQSSKKLHIFLKSRLVSAPHLFLSKIRNIGGRGEYSYEIYEIIS